MVACHRHDSTIIGVWDLAFALIPPLLPVRQDGVRKLHVLTHQQSKYLLLYS